MNLKCNYLNQDRLIRNLETAIRDVEIRAMFKGLSMCDTYSYQSKIDLISKEYCISIESVKKALHNDKD
jgi:hypothetical protein